MIIIEAKKRKEIRASLGEENIFFFTKLFYFKYILKYSHNCYLENQNTSSLSKIKERNEVGFIM
jgi:hypothetical protein